VVVLAAVVDGAVVVAAVVVVAVVVVAAVVVGVPVDVAGVVPVVGLVAGSARIVAAPKPATNSPTTRMSFAVLRIRQGVANCGGHAARAAAT
jgi:hypothetical protein